MVSVWYVLLQQQKGKPKHHQAPAGHSHRDSLEMVIDTQCWYHCLERATWGWVGIWYGVELTDLLANPGVSCSRWAVVWPHLAPDWSPGTGRTRFSRHLRVMSSLRAADRDTGRTRFPGQSLQGLQRQYWTVLSDPGGTYSSLQSPSNDWNSGPLILTDSPGSWACKGDCGFALNRANPSSLSHCCQESATAGLP